eukprot:8900150-Lingulodinium_polyedra.AAC.1
MEDENDEAKGKPPEECEVMKVVCRCPLCLASASEVVDVDSEGEHLAMAIACAKKGGQKVHTTKCTGTESQAAD